MNEERPQTESADIWHRLRQRIDQLRSDDRGQVDPEALARKLAGRAKMLRGRIGHNEAVGPQISFLGFSHGPQRYGIPISEIVEVHPLSDYTPVPGAPPFIPGAIHWRGSILSLVDLVKLFGIAELGLIDERTCVIVESAGRRIGIMAGGVEDLYDAPIDQLKPVPELRTEIPPDWVVGVHDENRLILRMEQIVQDERLIKWKATDGTGVQSVSYQGK